MKAFALVLIVVLTTVAMARAAQRWVPQPGIVRTDTTSTSSIRIGDRVRTYIMERNAIVFAESDDGGRLLRITTTNVRGTGQAGDAESFIANPAVIQRDDGKFVMVYDTSPETRPPFVPRRLFVRISDNGITFGSSAALPVTDLDRNPRGQIFQSVPDLVKLGDGSLHLYYAAGGTAVASMRSSDGGQAWVPDSGYRLGEARSSGPARAAYVDPDAIVLPDGSVLMYVAYSEFEAQCGGLGCQVIRVAISKDGLSFTLEPGVLLTPPTGSAGLVDPDVFQAADGRWRMLYGERAQRAINLRLAIRTE